MIILTYNTSYICEKHTFTRYYASYVFHLWFVHNKPFLMNSEKRQEIMLLFTPVRQRKIGKAEENYNQQKYLNHPYWNTDEFREGAVCYGRWLYSDLQLRYDTYKKSLIVVTPEKRITLQVDMRKVDYFVIEGQKFVPQGDCFAALLYDSFAALLYDSPQMCLTQYIVSTMESQVKKNDLYYSRFKKKSYFSLRSGGTDYVITSRSGFLKLFPTYKKQLKAYCRKERLDFKEDGGVRAMTRLTEYIDSLIHGK